MWFLLLSVGAVLLATTGLPAARRLPLAPPPEALVACYFLVAALLRLLVRNARLAAFERKARREARRKEDRKDPSTLGELGMGVGRGALQAVGGDLLGAGLSLATALLRGAASSLSARPPPQRERRRAARWEQLKAATCIAGTGLVCAGVAWEPLVHARLARAADAALVAAGMGAPTAPAPVRSPSTAAPQATPTSTATSTATPTATPTPAPSSTSTSASTGSSEAAHPEPFDSAAPGRGSAQDGLRAAGAESRGTPTTPEPDAASASPAPQR